MRKYNLIILAGGEDELWCRRYGHKKKAFLPLRGKPMISWVIEAFRRSKYIDNIVVVGPKELGRLNSRRYVRKRLAEGKSFIRNLGYAALYIKAVIYKFANNHSGYLISFCDTVFLTTDIINATLETITEFDPAIALHYVKKATIARNGYPVDNRTYVHIAGTDYTGSGIYYVKKFTKLLGVLNDIARLRQYRKTPQEILRYLNCEDKDLGEIEKALSKKLSIKVKIFISPYAQMGVDVDSPGDYEAAKLQFQEKSLIKQ